MYTQNATMSRPATATKGKKKKKAGQSASKTQYARNSLDLGVTQYTIHEENGPSNIVREGQWVRPSTATKGKKGKKGQSAAKVTRQYADSSTYNVREPVNISPERQTWTRTSLRGDVKDRIESNMQAPLSTHGNMFHNQNLENKIADV